MKTRQIIWTAVLSFSLAAIACAVYVLFRASLPVHNYHRIPPGTPRAEVYRLFGGPGWRPDCGVGIPPGEDPEFWETPIGTVRVDFDTAGVVIRALGPP